MDWKMISAVMVVAAVVVTLAMAGCGHRAFGPAADTPQARAEWLVKRVANRFGPDPFATRRIGPDGPGDGVSP